MTKKKLSARETSPSALEYHIRIKEIPKAERPRERLIDQGPSALSTQELLAIILRTGTREENAVNLAQRLLVELRGLEGLDKAAFNELCSRRGVGEAKAAQIKAALELGRRLLAARPDERLRITSPAQAADLVMMEMGTLEQEHMRVMLLNTKNQVLDIAEVYRGSLNTSVIRVAELFREATRQNCAAIIVVHNHPSGDPTPSPEDVAVTKSIVDAGKLLAIEVLDHIVIGRGDFVSLKERGLGFPRG